MASYKFHWFKSEDLWGKNPHPTASEFRLVNQCQVYYGIDFLGRFCTYNLLLKIWPKLLVAVGWPSILCVCSVFSSGSVQLHWSQWPSQNSAHPRWFSTSKGLLGAGPSGIMAADAIVTEYGALHVAGVPLVNPSTVVVWEVMPGLGNGIQATAKINATSSEFCSSVSESPFMAWFCSASGLPIFFARLSCFPKKAIAKVTCKFAKKTRFCYPENTARDEC